MCKVTLEDVPYFNAPIYLENKQQIGKVDEIFGSIKDYSVSIKLSEDVKAKSFTPNQKVGLTKPRQMGNRLKYKAHNRKLPRKETSPFSSPMLTSEALSCDIHS